MIYYIGNDLSIYNDIDKCTLEDAYEYLKDKKVLGLDIETTQKYNGIYPQEGLDPYTSKIIMVQIGDLENQYIVDYRHTNTIGKLSEILESKKIVKVGHNIKFEYKHIKYNEGIIINNLYDTMIVDQILYNGLQRKYSLQDLVKNYLNVNINKSTRYGFLHIGGRPFSKAELKYGADDVTYPLQIKDLQVERIKEYNLANCVRLEMLFIQVLGDIELTGMHLNEDAWKNLYEENIKLLESLKCKLDDYVIFNYPNSIFIEKQLDLFDTSTKCNINWASSQQVIELFKVERICPLEISKTTGKLSYTVNATVLKNHIRKLTLSGYKKTFIDTYLKYKEIEQRCTTFGLDFFKYINPITGRIHSNYRQILTTGRISSNGPNLQNIPSEASYRECFTAPMDRVLVNADYSGQEQIILANKSLEPNLLEFYDKELGDMHSYVASKLFSELKGYSLDEIKLHRSDLRQIAKGAGFAINYGGNGHTISKNLGMSPEDGDRVYDSYFKEFSELKKYFDKVQKLAIKTGYILIDKITNRKCFIQRNKLLDPKEIQKIKRNALNYPVQGEAGSITKLAAIFLREKLLRNNIDAQIVNLVHDEINVECFWDQAPDVAKHMETQMSRSADLWCKRVKLKATAKISKFWAH